MKPAPPSPAAQLAALTALIARLVACERGRRPRDETAEAAIADRILTQISMPPIGRQLYTLRRRLAALAAKTPARAIK
jgi:hypothetical protein